jgi:hypothetical protein
MGAFCPSADQLKLYERGISVPPRGAGYPLDGFARALDNLADAYDLGARGDGRSDVATEGGVLSGAEATVDACWSVVDGMDASMGQATASGMYAHTDPVNGQFELYKQSSSLPEWRQGHALNPFACALDDLDAAAVYVGASGDELAHVAAGRGRACAGARPNVDPPWVAPGGVGSSPSRAMSPGVDASVGPPAVAWVRLRLN